MVEDEERPTNGFQTARAVLRRRRRLALLTFGGAFAAVVSIVMFLPDLYRSSTTVLVDRQQIPDDLVKSTVTGDLEVRLQTISQEILSRSRLEGLIQRLGLYTELKKRIPMEEVIERMQEHIRMELKGSERRGDRMTVAFTISFSGPDPQKTALVANTLASFYIEENLKVREKQAAGTADFLRLQLEQMKEKLQAQEQQVRAFKERHVGELPQQLEANLATLAQLNAQLRLNSDSQIQVSEHQASVVKQLEEAEGSGPSGGARAVAERLAEMKKQLASLYTRFSDKYPDVVRVKAEIAVLEELLLSAGSGETEGKRALPTSPLGLQLRQDLAESTARSRTLTAEADRLRHSIAVYQMRVENAPRWEQEYRALGRDYETTQELYQTVLKQQREADIGESMEQRQKGEQFRIIDPALPAEEPGAPHRVQLIALGLLLSLALMAAAVLLAEQLDTSFHTVEELRTRFRDMALVSIPLMVSAADARVRRRRLALMSVSAAVCLVLIVGGSYLLANENGPLARLALK